MLADLRAMLRPGAKILDAGCGTGVLARRMRELPAPASVTASRPSWHSRSAAPLERPCCRAPRAEWTLHAALCVS